MTDQTETLKARLRADLKRAMLARHAAEAQAIRSLMAAIDNAQAVVIVERAPMAGQHRFGDGSAEVQRLLLSDHDLHALIEQAYATRQQAAEEMHRLGHSDRAEALRGEQAVIGRYRLG